MRPKQPGTHRVEYDFRWYSWALPLHVGLGTSLFPTAESGTDVSQWIVQRVLIVDVFCFRMKAVIVGPLFDDFEEEP